MNGSSAIGHQITGAVYNDFLPQGMIRGIVGDAREEGVNTQPAPTVYSCFSAAESVSELPGAYPMVTLWPWRKPSACKVHELGTGALGLRLRTVLEPFQ